MKKVLIVDDSTFIRMRLRSLLSINGYQIIGEAENGIEAVEKYKKLVPDIVTMDIEMPYKNGVDATKEIIKFDKNANIVVISSVEQKEYIFESLRVGAKEFLFKPLDNDLILSIMNAL